MRLGIGWMGMMNARSKKSVGREKAICLHNCTRCSRRLALRGIYVLLGIPRALALRASEI